MREPVSVLRVGRKEAPQPVQFPVLVEGIEVARFPTDREADYAYYSKPGGFVPLRFALDTILAHVMHYGAGVFEGERWYDSPFGPVRVEPWMSMARLMHSETVIHPVLAKHLRELFQNDPTVEEVIMDRITPRDFYALAKRAYAEGRDPEFLITIIKKKDGRRVREKQTITLKLRAMCRESIREYSLQDLDTIIKTLGLANRVVSSGHFPDALKMTMSGYIRALVWIAGEGGLKIPTEGKPAYFAVVTCPWGLYLDERGYKTGLDTLVGPYPRIGKDMRFDAKVVPNYGNSAANINPGLAFGFGEILALDSNGRIVEGSAENVFIFRERRGRIVAYTPPVSSGCLPGTTRDRVIRTLERMGIEVIYEALTPREAYNALAIILTGTGAQMIHVRSINEVPAVSIIEQMTQLRSEEETGERFRLRRRDFERRTHLINDGRQHPIVEQVRSAYLQAMLDAPQEFLVPVYAIDFERLARLFGLGVEEITTSGDRADITAGRFSRVIDGRRRSNKVELSATILAAARIVQRAIRKNRSPQVPLTRRVRRL